MKQGGKEGIKEGEGLKQVQQAMRSGRTNNKKKAMEGKEKEKRNKRKNSQDICTTSFLSVRIH